MRILIYYDYSVIHQITNRPAAQPTYPRALAAGAESACSVRPPTPFERTMYPPYQQPTSRTHHLVLQACDPSLPEPAYDRNLTLADYINDKKANTPREAAMAVVAEVNSRNQHVGVLALHVSFWILLVRSVFNRLQGRWGSGERRRRWDVS